MLFVFLAGGPVECSVDLNLVDEIVNEAYNSHHTYSMPRHQQLRADQDESLDDKSDEVGSHASRQALVRYL